MSCEKHYDNIPMQSCVTFHDSMNDIFHMKFSGIFLIYGPNTDFGCLLELPQRSDSNKHSQSMFKKKIRKIMYTPANPTVLYIKCGLRGLHCMGC